MQANELYKIKGYLVTYQSPFSNSLLHYERAIMFLILSGVLCKLHEGHDTIYEFGISNVLSALFGFISLLVLTNAQSFTSKEGIKFANNCIYFCYFDFRGCVQRSLQREGGLDLQTICIEGEGRGVWVSNDRYHFHKVKSLPSGRIFQISWPKNFSSQLP